MSLFLEKEGLQQAKMADIAKYCNISVGALYKLFNSKDELFYEYVNYQIELFYKKLLQAFEILQTPQERILYFIRLKFRIFEEKKTLLLDTVAADPLFFAKLNVSKQNPAKKIYEIVADELQKMGIKDSLKYSYILNGLTLGAIEFWLTEGKKLDADENYEMFLKIVKDK